MSPSLTQSSVSTVSSDSRSPSPLRRQGTPATFLPTGRKYEGNVSDESDAAIPSENTVGQGILSYNNDLLMSQTIWEAGT